MTISLKLQTLAHDVDWFLFQIVTSEATLPCFLRPPCTPTLDS